MRNLIYRLAILFFCLTSCLSAYATSCEFSQPIGGGLLPVPIEYLWDYRRIEISTTPYPYESKGYASTQDRKYGKDKWESHKVNPWNVNAGNAFDHYFDHRFGAGNWQRAPQSLISLRVLGDPYAGRPRLQSTGVGLYMVLEPSMDMLTDKAFVEIIVCKHNNGYWANPEKRGSGLFYADCHVLSQVQLQDNSVQSIRLDFKPVPKGGARYRVHAALRYRDSTRPSLVHSDEKENIAAPCGGNGYRRIYDTADPAELENMVKKKLRQHRGAGINEITGLYHRNKVRISTKVVKSEGVSSYPPGIGDDLDEEAIFVRRMARNLESLEVLRNNKPVLELKINPWFHSTMIKFTDEIAGDEKIEGIATSRAGDQDRAEYILYRKKSGNK